MDMDPVESKNVLPNPSTVPPGRRVLVEYGEYGSNKTRYCAASISGIGGDRIWLSTPFGEHAFSRADGRWIDGPCLNLESGAIHQLDLLENEIVLGSVAKSYECTDHTMTHATKGIS